MRYVKCPRCEINYISEEEQLCPVCLEQLGYIKAMHNYEEVTSIRKIIMQIYGDFSRFIYTNDSLCDLKSLHFQAGQLPDYSNIHIQQLYLLRYVYAYAFEYKCMYQTVLERVPIREEIEVTSLGCGNMIDYWALATTLTNNIAPDCKIKYLGVDVIDWQYKVLQRKRDELVFLQKNVAEWIEEVEQLNSDIYFFPKSISEFSKEEFETICGAFQKKLFSKNRIHVLISLRSDEGSMARDAERSKKIMEAIKSNGFSTDDDAEKYMYLTNGDKLIREIDTEFEYPGIAIDLLKQLIERCNAFAQENADCDQSCKNYLNRWPVLRGKNICYQVFTFYRED